MKLVTSSLALLAVLSGCKSDTEAPVASTLTIAFEGPLTGDQASNGQDMLRGVRLAVAETNLKGGVLGLQVVLVEADDKADAETGKRAALEVVAGDSVAVIGPYNSARPTSPAAWCRST
jgi:branched-chain amino acid transport system substrate-binding protein